METIKLVGAEEVMQASRNIDSSVEYLQRVLTSFSEDMASIAYRFETAAHTYATAVNRASGMLPPGNFGPL